MLGTHMILDELQRRGPETATDRMRGKERGASRPSSPNIWVFA